MASLVVDPQQLNAQKQNLAPVPIDAGMTATGSVHLGPGHHGVLSEQRHLELLAAQRAGTKDSWCDWNKFDIADIGHKLNPNVPVPAVCKVVYHQRGAGDKEVLLGQTLSVAETQTAPRVEWPLVTSADLQIGNAPPLYTVIMCDPDAPSRETPKMRNYIHWLLVNVPGPYQLDRGFAAAPYEGPAPPPNTGFHRYVTIVYAQRGVIEAGKLSVIKNRAGWSLDSFCSSWDPVVDTSKPIAGNFFFAQNDVQDKRVQAKSIFEQRAEQERKEQREEKKSDKQER
jgi:hypothetical protein